MLCAQSGSLAASYLFITLPDLPSSSRLAASSSQQIDTFNFSSQLRGATKTAAQRLGGDQCLVNGAQRQAVLMNVFYLLPLSTSPWRFALTLCYPELTRAVASLPFRRLLHQVVQEAAKRRSFGQDRRSRRSPRRRQSHERQGAMSCPFPFSTTRIFYLVSYCGHAPHLSSFRALSRLFFPSSRLLRLAYLSLSGYIHHLDVTSRFLLHRAHSAVNLYSHGHSREIARARAIF